MEQDFHGNSQVNVTCFSGLFLLYPSPDCAQVWFESFLHLAQDLLYLLCPWSLKLMTLQAVERTWIGKAILGGSGANGLNVL